MTEGGYIFANAFGGLVAGAIGAAVADASDSHPVIKGALVTGGISTVIAIALLAGAQPQQGKQISSGVSGLSSYGAFS